MATTSTALVEFLEAVNLIFRTTDFGLNIGTGLQVKVAFVRILFAVQWLGLAWAERSSRTAIVHRPWVVLFLLDRRFRFSSPPHPQGIRL